MLSFSLKVFLVGIALILINLFYKIEVLGVAGGLITGSGIVYIGISLYENYKYKKFIKEVFK